MQFFLAISIAVAATKRSRNQPGKGSPGRSRMLPDGSGGLLRGGTAQCYSDSVDSESSFCLGCGMRKTPDSRLAGRLAAVGAAVRDRRLTLGLSQEALADFAGLHRTYIGSVERGERNVSLGNLYALADALGIRPADLLTD